MTPEKFKYELSTCGSEDSARALLAEAKNILSAKEFAAMVTEISSGHTYRAFVRRLAWTFHEKL